MLCITLTVVDSGAFFGNKCFVHSTNDINTPSKFSKKTVYLNIYHKVWPNRCLYFICKVIHFFEKYCLCIFQRDDSYTKAYGSFERGKNVCRSNQLMKSLLFFYIFCA